MSTIPRVSSAIAGEPAHFGSVLAHQPEIAARFFELYGAFWGSDVLAARIKEVARMRNARVTECGFCRNVRFDKALGEGLVEVTEGNVLGFPLHEDNTGGGGPELANTRDGQTENGPGMQGKL